MKLVKDLDFYAVNTHELVYLKPEVFLDLNINNTSNLIGKTTSVQPMGARQKIYDTNKLKHDTFEVKFNETEAREFLDAQINYDVYPEEPQYNDKQKNFVIQTMNKNPKLWTPFKNIAEIPDMKGDDVIQCLKNSKKAEDFIELGKIALIKDKYDEAKVSKGCDYVKLSKMDKESKQNAKTLLEETSLAPNYVLKYLETLKGKRPDINILSKRVKALDNEYNCLNSNEYTVELGKNEYSSNEFNINVIKKPFYLAHQEVLDKNGLISAKDITQYENGNKSYTIEKYKDRNNTIIKTRREYDKDSNTDNDVTNQIHIIRDKKGNIIEKITTDRSEINGIYNIKKIHADGKVEVLSSGTIDKFTGIESVKKDMTSLDGTRTQYLYENDPKGNRISDYKITDKDGNVLLNNSTSFEIINDNKFISSKNNKKYEINVSEEKIDIKNINDENDKASIDINSRISGDKNRIIKVLKQISGDELIELAKNVKTFEGIEKAEDSAFNEHDKKITTGDNMFVILHELGHTKDMSRVQKLHNNKDLQKIFNKEKEAFLAKFPQAERKNIDYFLNQKDHYKGKDGGLTEAIAESNALLGTHSSLNLTAIRSQYLQQYFPRTIAFVNNAFEK